MVSEIPDNNMISPIFYPQVSYWSYDNAVYVPLGVLQQPIFSLNDPIAKQYGTIGAMIGSAIARAFDRNGVYRGPAGRNWKLWLDAKSNFGFENMVSCVRYQYSTFHRNSQKTIDADMSDNAGLNAAYKAFLKESPGASQSTKEQFFNSFTQMYCSNDPVNDTKNSFVTPPKWKVVGPFQNSHNFKDVFGCPVKSTYVPKHHCDVWSAKYK